MAGVLTATSSVSQMANIETFHEQTKHGLVIQINPTKLAYHVREDIILTAEFKNNSRSEIQVGGYHVGDAEQGKFISWLTRYIISDTKGKILEVSGPIVKSGKEPRLVPIKLSPNETYRINKVPIGAIELKINNQWVTINSTSGQYKIQMVYFLEKGKVPKGLPNLWKKEVFSNITGLTIVK